LEIIEKEIENYGKKYLGFDYKFIEIDSIVVGSWTRLKCQYGCANYKKSLTCPPYSPKAEEFRDMLKSYNHAILFQVSIAAFDEDVSGVTKMAVDLENIFARMGFHKVFGLGGGPCMLCEECNLEECVHPNLARPAMEACGIDVHETIENNGYDILGVDEENNSYFCYGLVLLD